MRRWRLGACAVGITALCACATLPQRPALVAEHALPLPEHGVLRDYGGRIEEQLAPGESAHWLLDRNELAFTARLALTDQAATTLDVQYFIWQDDATGLLLTSRLLAAADRGVKVRLLLDDFGVATSRGEIVQLDAHPNVEVRVFNPWAARGSRISKAVEFVVHSRRLNQRMHNKTYIADGSFAIVGGRNIGDRYFGLFSTFVQDDLDVLVAGPVVRDVEQSFDLYWNSANTYPVTLFDERRAPIAPIATTRAELATAVGEEAALLGAFPLQRAEWHEYFDGLTGTFAAGPAELYCDSPDIQDAGRARLYTQFKALVASAQREVLISSAYFIPDRDFRDLIRELVGRGVRVAIVTNSLATNNHVVAHTGYRRWRREVLASGAELYELRPDAAARDLYVTRPAMPAALGLHTKAVVVDGRTAFIGSPNVDTRSMVTNTEIGVVTGGEELARRLGALIERDMAPQNAWRVTLSADGWLTWSSDVGTLRRQPAKGFRQRAVEFLLNLLPLKNQA